MDTIIFWILLAGASGVIGNYSYDALKKWRKKRQQIQITTPTQHKPSPTTPTLLTAIPAEKVQKLVGRKSELNKLDKHINGPKPVVLVNGLGGIGKTELAKTFFLRNYQNYAFAAWVDCTGPLMDSLVAAFDPVRSGPLMQFEDTDTLAIRFQKLLAGLERLPGETLLAVDNLDNAHDPHLDTLLKMPPHVRLLATSRLDLSKRGFNTFKLDVLSPAQCRALFYRWYNKSKDNETVDAIVSLCHRHTLTVELLARTAQNSGADLQWLLQTLREKGFNLNRVIPDEVGTFWHDETAKKSFFNHMLTIFDLSEVTDEEFHLMLNLAVLPSMEINKETLKEWLKLDSNHLLNGLAQKGWLKTDETESTVYMHPVIREVARFKKSPDATICKELILSLAWKLKKEPGDNPLDKKPFVVFADSVAGGLADQDENLAALANNLSAIYQGLGQLDQAREFQEKALSIDEKTLVPLHPSLATSYNNLSLIYQDLGQLDQAREFQEKALKIREQILDPLHPSLATSYHNLSLIYKDLQNYPQALEFSQKAVSILSELFPNGHPNLDVMKKNLAIIREEAEKE